MPSDCLSSIKYNEVKDVLNYDLILALVIVIALGTLAFLGGYFSTTLVRVAAV